MVISNSKKDYHSEVSLDPGSNNLILSALKDSLRSPDRETCGVFAWDDQYHFDPKFIPLNNFNSYDPYSFLVNDSIFYKLYLNKKIISLYHSHINCGPELSLLDREVSSTLALPSFVFSTQTKETCLFYPTSYNPPILENRLFIPYLQDCITFVKDFFKLELNIDLCKTITNWSRRKHSSNNTLIKIIESYFDEVNIFSVQNNDLLVFSPTVSELYHVGVYVEDKYVFHHSFNGLPRKELFSNSIINKVYKVYRYKV